MKALASRRFVIVLWVASVAVAAAASGTAATLITGKQIRDGSLTGTDIRDRSLTSRDVKPGSIRLAALAADARPKAAPAAQPVVVTGADYRMLIASGRDAYITVLCPAGRRAVGGGFTAVSPLMVKRDGPNPAGDGWAINVRDTLTPSGQANVITPYVVCL